MPLNRSHLPLGLLLITSALASACGGATPEPKTAAQAPAPKPEPAEPAGPSPEEVRAELERMMARELAEGQAAAVDVRSDDGEMSLKLITTGEGVTVSKLEGDPDSDVSGYAIVAPFADGQQQCFVYTERKDTATLLWQFAQETALKVDPKATFQMVGAGAAEGRPFLFTNALYSVQSEQGRLIGDVKLASGSVNGAALVCVLDVPGFRKSFEKAFATSLASLDAPSIRQEAQDPARYHEITVMHAGPALAGFAETQVGDGDKKSIERNVEVSGVLMRTAEGGLSVTDGVDVQLAKRGRVFEQTSISVKDGETEFELKLEQQGNDRSKDYAVSGAIQGKPIEGKVSFQEPLLGAKAAQQALAKFMRAKKPESLTIPDWNPSADPLAARTETVRRLQGAEPFNAELTADPLVMRAQVDETGGVIAGEAPIGPTVLKAQRVWVHGKL